MTDKNFCMSSYLAYRYVERPDVDFYEGMHHENIQPIPEEKRVLVHTAEEIDRDIQKQFDELKAKGEKLGIMLSGGMDFANLAAYMPGCDAYTFRFIGGAERFNQELQRAEYYARKWNMKLHYVEIDWDTVENYLDACMEAKNAPVHSIEPQLLQGALQAKADGVNLAAPAADKKPAFDIAKFSGIFAAIGLAIGFITDAVVKLVSGIAQTPVWKTLLVVLGIMLVISGPSCLLAWMKLRKRNLGPVLNANGWAINSVVKVNTIFGKTLTSTAKYPIIKAGDPFVKKTSAGKKVLRVVIAVVVVAGIAAGLYFTGKLGKIGLPYPKEEAATEQVEAAAETVVEAPAAENAAENVAPAGE